ncbi:MAG TPA: zinc ribbon domain-containing protein [Vicinamibacterales bacterium]|nr:zinc ribbon domain-containing protein [Vicinamibacterales bacterium]
MTAHTLAARLGASVAIDLCLACQSFWFDGYESLQLSPASTLALFQIIGDAATATRQAMPPFAACPRCGLRLQPVEDRQRSTRFRYGRCPRGHGRFITFFDFLREKNFITTLSEADVAELRAQVQTVNCSNCGAPIDLQRTAVCAHCGSPLSMFDLRHAGDVLEQLRNAAQKPDSANPALAFDLLRARRDAERAVADSRDDQLWTREWRAGSSVADNVIALARWLGGKV